MNKFCEVCAAVGRALDIEEAKKLVGSGSELVVGDGVNHAMIVEEGLDDFASLDYISVLELEELDVRRMKQMVESRGGASSS